MKSNYGVYMMSILIGLYLVFFVVHVYTAQKALMNILKDVLKAKGIEDIKDIDIYPNLKEKKDVKQNDKNEQKKEEKKEENVEEPIRKSGKKRTTKSKKHKHKKKECEQFTQPNISVFPGNREEEEEDDGTVQSQIVAHNLPSEYDVKKANQIGCINLITDVFNDLLKKKGERLLSFLN